MNHCLYCGSRVIWNSDFDSQDVGFEQEGITSFYSCCDYEGCGAQYEVTKLFDFDDKFIIDIYFLEE